MNNFSISEPKPYAKVERQVTVKGSIPIKLLGKVEGFSHRLLLDLLDVHGRTMVGSSVNINLPTRTGDPDQLVTFAFPFTVDLNYFPIVQSEGRMAIRLSVNGGNFDRDQIEIFLPIVFKIPEPKKGFNQEIIKKHGTLELRVKQYRIDAVKYAEELGKIMNRRRSFFESAKSDPGSAYEITDEFAQQLSYAIDNISIDDEIKGLEEKYKESLQWSGPLLHGVVGWLNGFCFQVYSHDHGKHFHVIHKEKEIDARFSFPEIKLIDYKGRSKELSSKVIKTIEDYFKIPENFQKLELALAKQISQ